MGIVVVSAEPCRQMPIFISKFWRQSWESRVAGTEVADCHSRVSERIKTHGRSRTAESMPLTQVDLFEDEAA